MAYVRSVEFLALSTLRFTACCSCAVDSRLRMSYTHK